MMTAIKIASSSAMMTSCSVFFITRQRSGRIGSSPRIVVPNPFVTASFTQ